MSAQSHLFREFEKLTFSELKGSRRLLELVGVKLDLVRDFQTADPEIDKLASLFAEVLTETLRGNYDALSVRAFAHICYALDYLLDPTDFGTAEGELDTGPHGLASDKALLVSTAARFQNELNAFRTWKARQVGEA
jgi:hypothetical protein